MTMSMSCKLRHCLRNLAVHQKRLMSSEIKEQNEQVKNIAIEARKQHSENMGNSSDKATRITDSVSDVQLSKQKTFSTASQGLEARSINPALAREVKLFYFDTLQLASKFQKHGFTQEQTACIVEAFVEVLNTSIEHQTKIMVSKPEQEIMVQQLMAHIGSVKKDMVILEKSEFTMLRNENEKQTADIKLMRSLVNDEISKLQANVRLDVNLERSRSKEAHLESEKQLQILRNKIDTDVANLRTTYEQYRNDVMKFSIATLISTTVVILGVMRLLT